MTREIDEGIAAAVLAGQTFRHVGYVDNDFYGDSTIWLKETADCDGDRSETPDLDDVFKALAYRRVEVTIRLVEESKLV